MVLTSIILYQSARVSLDTMNGWCYNDVMCSIGDEEAFKAMNPDYCSGKPCKKGDDYNFKEVVFDPLVKKCKYNPNGPFVFVNEKRMRCEEGTDGCFKVMAGCLIWNTLDGPVDISLLDGNDTIDKILKTGRA